jgi:hypothetical protein
MVDMAVRVDVPDELQVVLRDEVGELFLLLPVIAGGIDDDGFACRIPQEVTVHHEGVKYKYLDVHFSLLRYKITNNAGRMTIIMFPASMEDCFIFEPSMTRKQQFSSMIMAVLLCTAGVLQGQTVPVRVTLGNESTAIPFTRFFTVPVHPSVQLGTDFTYRMGKHSRLYQTANLGYLFHNHLYQGFWVSSEAGYDYRFGFGLNLKVLLGAGYLHTFATQQEYQFRDGAFESGMDWGNPRLVVSLALGAGYRLHRERQDSPEVFLLYKPWFEYPYSPGFIPVMTHITLEAGIRFPLRFNMKQDE